MDTRPAGSPIPRSVLALPAGAAALLCLGTLAAALHGRMPGLVLDAACAACTAATCVAAEPLVALPMSLIAWMTATAFASAPFGQLRPATPNSALAAGLVATTASVTVLVSRRRGVRDTPDRRTLDRMNRLAGVASAVDVRRRVLGIALAAVLLPLLTVVLTHLRDSLSLADDLLAYLIVVVAVTVVGGFWPAIAAAVAASLLLNWFFTAPFHTFTIAEPDNLLAVLLFTIVAVSVSGVVHIAARRAQLAARSRFEAEAMLRLARTVLGGEDTPEAVLASLRATLGVSARLQERVGERWVDVAVAGPAEGPVAYESLIRDDLRLVVRGDTVAGHERVLEAAAGQCVAALDRDRLRTQAAQTEALAAGNRMRTALLAAVSHDLRTPLASIKASISSLRQADVAWTAEDEAALLETIEDSTDRLHGLIANLLDMSRVQTGALQPYVAPTAVDEVVPAALRDLPDPAAVVLDVPEDLPLVATDAGLLERALANLLSNAQRFSAPDRPAEVVARDAGDHVAVAVVDHGPGVPVEDRALMFQPFQRLGDRTAGTGVGLGLAVARGFVEAIGGRLDASDTPGGGLTMTVSLPVARARRAAAAP